MEILKKTKIIATLGPAIIPGLETLKDLEDPKFSEQLKIAKKNLADLFNVGVNVIRLNFSHGSNEAQLVKLMLAKQVAKELNINISTMLDTKGPEIRVCKLPNKEIKIESGSEVKIYTIKKDVNETNAFAVSDYSGKYNMAKDVKEGDTIFVDDGKLDLTVISVQEFEGIIKTKANNSWNIKENKRINLPNANYSIPFMSEKDKNDIIFAIQHKMDYIAASFVNSAKDIKQIKSILKEHNATHIQIVAKIESMSAIKALEEITYEADAIMIARGDLGLEVPYFDVPTYEKYMIKNCRLKVKPVIVATQMLDSLETKTQPTRAEVTDVFYAVDRGTDCTMLSGETANGLYPVLAAKVMAKICETSESTFDFERSINIYFSKTPFFNDFHGQLAVKVASLVAPKRVIANEGYEYSSIVVFGSDAKLIHCLSNIRCAAPIFFITDKKEYATRFGLNYGVYVEVVDDLQQVIKNKSLMIEKINKNLPEIKKTVVIVDNEIDW